MVIFYAKPPSWCLFFFPYNHLAFAPTPVLARLQLTPAFTSLTKPKLAFFVTYACTIAEPSRVIAGKLKEQVSTKMDEIRNLVNVIEVLKPFLSFTPKGFSSYWHSIYSCLQKVHLEKWLSPLLLACCAHMVGSIHSGCCETGQDKKKSLRSEWTCLSFHIFKRRIQECVFSAISVRASLAEDDPKTSGCKKDPTCFLVMALKDSLRRLKYLDKKKITEIPRSSSSSLHRSKLVNEYWILKNCTTQWTTSIYLRGKSLENWTIDGQRKKWFGGT